MCLQFCWDNQWRYSCIVCLQSGSILHICRRTHRVVYRRCCSEPRTPCPRRHTLPWACTESSSTPTLYLHTHRESEPPPQPCSKSFFSQLLYTWIEMHDTHISYTHLVSKFVYSSVTMSEVKNEQPVLIMLNYVNNILLSSAVGYWYYWVILALSLIQQLHYQGICCLFDRWNCLLELRHSCHGCKLAVRDLFMHVT